MAKVPTLNDPDTVEFVQILIHNKEIRMRADVPMRSYPDNHQLRNVENRPVKGALPSKCWFNCLREEAEGRGEVVYGWSIWYGISPNGLRFYGAEHHAVLRTGEHLVDVTPYILEDGSIGALSATILFMPDQRVPFDTVRGTFPPTFVWLTENNETMWGMRETETGPWRRLPGYGVMRIAEPNWQRYFAPAGAR